MAHHTREDCLRLGIPLAETVHRFTRRSYWEDYFTPGRYGVTIHLVQDEEGRYLEDAILGRVESVVEGLTKDEVAAVPVGRRTATRLTDVGRIVDWKMHEIGHWKNERLVKMFSSLKLINYVVMPTHVHFTIEITKALPKVMRRGRVVQITLSDFVRGWKQGTSSGYYRLKAGETVEEIVANPDARMKALASGEEVPDFKRPSIWEKNYCDKILNTYDKLTGWIRYVEMNTYFWWMKDVRPHLFEHRLHVAMRMGDGEVMDVSAYGCLFLLRRTERVQVMCHRLARKGMLTREEWERYVRMWKVFVEAGGMRVGGSNNIVRGHGERGGYGGHEHGGCGEQERWGGHGERGGWTMEEEREARSLFARVRSRYDRDWLVSRNADCVCPIPYEETEAFRKQREAVLHEARFGAVPVSPTVSEGEKLIMQAVMDENLPVIKVNKEPFTARRHPSDRDRVRCAEGLLLCVGPWEVPEEERNGVPADTLYAKFHNLNDMAARMCGALEEMRLVKEYVD